MTDFVLEQTPKSDIDKAIMAEDLVLIFYKYANFLKQPLKIEMFVPCDSEGNVLEEPVNYNAYSNELSREDYSYNFIDCVNYRQAKEKVLFKGFEVEKFPNFYLVCYNNKEVYVSWNNSKTIESLTYLNLTLTDSAIKQLGL